MLADSVAINNVDAYTNLKYRTVLIGEQTWIPSLPTFGHATNNKAELPLINHYHKEKMEFVILIEGIQKFVASGVEYTLHGGNVFVTQPNEEHSTGRSPQSINEMLWFQIDLSEHTNFLGLNEQNSIHLFNRVLNFKGRKFQIDRQLINKFVEVFKLLCQNSIDEKIKGQNLFRYCLLCLLDENPISDILSADIEAAKQYIITHITEPIYMDELVGSSGLSVSHFKHKFKEQIGLTPREYINHMKIDKAKEVVANSEKSITDIAFEFGFSTSNYFCVVFKQFTGQSPKDYRKHENR